MSKTITVLMALLMLSATSAAETPYDFFLDGYTIASRLRFDSQNLYGYINGGAELFLEFGFDELLVVYYENGDSEFNLELYKMAEPAAALGIYLAKCGPETPAPSVKARNTLNRYQLTAVKGCCCIQINNSSGDTSMQKPMIHLMNHLSDQIEPAEKPALLDAIPLKNLVPGSIRLIRGPYALQPIYTFGEGDILQLEGVYYGIVADYRFHYSDLTQITIPYGEADKAASVLKTLKSGLDPYLEIIKTWPNGFAFKDYRKRFGSAQRVADTLILRIDLTVLPSYFKPESEK
ncbi:hypothetical protein GF407_04490 [candidate division KSB1 bacterium]|nr:hypothetical protein [candidate division KSB1 bacterium]